MLRNNLTIPVINYHLVHRLLQCPYVLTLQKSFSFRYFRLQEYLRQQENTTSCKRMACSMITISKNVTLMSAG